MILAHVLLTGCDHPSTSWPENLFPNTGNATMYQVDISFHVHGDSWYQPVLHLISYSCSGDGPPLSLDDVIDTLKVQQLFAHIKVGDYVEKTFFYIRII